MVKHLVALALVLRLEIIQALPVYVGVWSINGISAMVAT